MWSDKCVCEEVEEQEKVKNDEVEEKGGNYKYKIRRARRKRGSPLVPLRFLKSQENH